MNFCTYKVINIFLAFLRRLCYFVISRNRSVLAFDKDITIIFISRIWFNKSIENGNVYLSNIMY